MRRPPLRKAVAGLIACSALTVPAAAVAAGAAAAVANADQTAVTAINQEAADQNVFTFDYGVPESPALTVLGVAKDKITQSNELKPFVLALPGLVEGKQTDQAIALDVSLDWILHGGRSNYVPNRMDSSYTGWLKRTRVATAVYGGLADTDPSKAKASRLAFGLSTSLLDASDPQYSRLPGEKAGQSAMHRCMVAAAPILSAKLVLPDKDPHLHDLRAQRTTLAARVAVGPPLSQSELQTLVALNEEIGKLEAPLDAAAQKAFAASEAAKIIPSCVLVAGLAARLAPDIDFGVGAGWSGDPGKLSGFKDGSAVVWASFRTSLLAGQPNKSVQNAGEMASSYKDLTDWYNNLDYWVMIGASSRIGVDEVIATGDATKPQVKANTYSVWGGVEFHTKSSRLAAQAGWEKTAPKFAADKAFDGSRSRYLITFDQKLADTGMWMTLVYGQATGTGSLPSDKTVKLSFTYAMPTARKIFNDF